MSSWKQVNPSKNKIIMYGAGDQARVNMPILKDIGCEIVALVDDTPNILSPFDGILLLPGYSELCKWIVDKDVSGFGFVISIGNPFGHIRCMLGNKLTRLGMKSVSFSDNTALIRDSVFYAAGLQVMPQAIIHNNVQIQEQCIVNTRSLVEHDCVLENGVEIGPGAILCGRVIVGENSWIGAGATITPRVKIGKNVIVGAGATVVSDVPDGVTVVGTPAKILSGKIPESKLYYSD